MFSLQVFALYFITLFLKDAKMSLLADLFLSTLFYCASAIKDEALEPYLYFLTGT